MLSSRNKTQSGLSFDLFNLCLETITRTDNIGTIYNKELQILGFVDGIDITVRDLKYLEKNIVSVDTWVHRRTTTLWS